MSFSAFAAEERVNAAAKFEALSAQVHDHGAFVVRNVDGKTACHEATRSEALLIAAARSAETRVFGERSGRIQGTASAGLDIILRGTAQLDANPAAKAAFQRAAEIWESKIANPITVYVDVDFGSTFFGEPFSSEDVIAAAQSDVRYLDANLYGDIRGLLIARADNANETAVYAALPALSLPTDLGLTTGTSAASMLFRAIGAMPATAAPADSGPRIGFNNSFPYDFDPTNGITPGQTDFEGVVVHEIGHMLGFVSMVGYEELGVSLPPSIFDYFRFRPGVTLATFAAAQRIQSSGGTQVYFTGNGTLALSTGRADGTGGDENQASHWKDDAISGSRIGVMDPTLTRGVRSAMTDADLQAFGMMGYNIVSGETPGGQTPAAPTNLTATGTSTSNIRLNWTDNSNNETEFRIEQKIGSSFVDIGGAAANATQFNVGSLAAGQAVTFRVRARNIVGDSAYTNEATGTTNSNPGSCTPSDTVVCLLNNRFRVHIDYVNPFSNPPNQPGTFRAARLLQGVQNPDTALFGFSSAQAVEVVVRLQDTRPFAPRFDIYYGGMTDVGYTVNVTDTQTGVTRQYTNTPGRVGGGVDRTSFPTSVFGSPDQLTSGGRDSFPAEMTGYKKPVGIKTVGAVAPFKTKNRLSANAGGAGACAEVEPNETTLLADELTLGAPCTGVANFADSYQYVIEYDGGEEGRVQDVFEFTTGTSGAISVNLTYTYAPADLDVVLFKQVGTGLEIIDVAAGTSTTEIINANEPAGTYYVGVSAYSNGSPYTITVNGPGAPAAPAAPSNLVATGTSTSVIRLTWNDNSNNETAFVVEQKVGANFVAFAPLPANTTALNVTDFAPGASATFRVKARNGSGDSSYSNEATGTTQGGGPTTCTPSDTVICLLNNRFRVKIDYVNPFSNPPNQPGTFRAARLLQGVQNPDTGLFGFANPQAVEVVVRIQDTRPFAPRFDVYYGGMTDVGYTVTVTDTQTGTTRQYTNTVGTVGGGVDRTSFPAN